MDAAPVEEEACAESEEGDDNLSNVEADILLSWLDDKMSGVDGLLFIGEGVPIDKRSRRTSVPAFGAWLVPTHTEKDRNREENINKYKSVKIRFFHRQSWREQQKNLI